MENKNLLTLAITLTVGIILAGSLMMPVISDATTTEETFRNVGSFYMTDKDDNYTLTYDPVNLSLTVNDETYAFTEIPEGRWTIVTVDGFMFRFQNYESENYGLYKVSTTATTLIASTSTSTGTESWTFDEGSYIYNGSTVSTYTVGSFRGFDPTGDYVMTDGTHKPVVDGDSSIIIGHGLTYIGLTNIPFYIYGTVDDGVTVNTKDTITVSNLKVNASAITRLVDCYTLDSITFTATDGTNTINATYDRIIVPVEITAARAAPLNSGEIAILNALPILIIVALVVVAAGALYLKRDD